MKLKAKKTIETKTYQVITYEVEVTPAKLVAMVQGNVQTPDWYAQIVSADPGTLKVFPMSFKHSATGSSEPGWTEPMLRIQWRCSHLEEKGGPEDGSGDEPRSMGVDQRERLAG